MNVVPRVAVGQFNCRLVVSPREHLKRHRLHIPINARQFLILNRDDQNGTLPWEGFAPLVRAANCSFRYSEEIRFELKFAPEWRHAFPNGLYQCSTHVNLGTKSKIAMGGKIPSLSIAPSPQIHSFKPLTRANRVVSYRGFSLFVFVDLPRASDSQGPPLVQIPSIETCTEKTIQCHNALSPACQKEANNLIMTTF